MLDIFVTDNVVPVTPVTSRTSLVVPSDTLTTEPVPTSDVRLLVVPESKVIVVVPVKSEKVCATVLVVLVVILAAVVSNPIVPINVLEFTPVSTNGTANQYVPSGDISTVLSTASAVITKDAVDAEARNYLPLPMHLYKGIALVDLVPKLKVALPTPPVGSPNPDAVTPLPLVGTTHTNELSEFEILTVCVPILEPSGWDYANRITSLPRKYRFWNKLLQINDLLYY